jgi:hypothetical protein
MEDPNFTEIVEAAEAAVTKKAEACEHHLSDEYEWLKHRFLYNATPHMSDGYVASEVRMLMRGQLNHEAVVTTAANRICKLSIENAVLHAALVDARRERDEARDTQADADAWGQFLLKANPQKVLSILSALEAAEKERDELRDFRDQIIKHYPNQDMNHVDFRVHAYQHAITLSKDAENG